MKRFDFESLQLGEILGDAREVVNGGACQEENENLRVLVAENELNELDVRRNAHTDESQLGVAGQFDVVVLQQYWNRLNRVLVLDFDLDLDGVSQSRLAQRRHALRFCGTKQASSSLLGEL